MTLKLLRHTTRYLITLFLLRFSGLTLVVYLINTFETVPFAALPLGLLALYLLFQIYYDIKTLVLPSRRNSIVVTISTSGICLHSLPLFVKWRDIESVNTCRTGRIFNTIRIKLKDPESFVGRNGWMLWLRFKINSQFRCDLLLPAGAFDASAQEITEIINKGMAGESIRQEELRRIPSTAVSELMAWVRANAVAQGITLYEQASDAEICVFEQTLNVKLPDNLIEFYRFCNGFESEEDWFRIIPLGEILERDDFEIGESCVFDFAEYMTYCDSWQMKIAGSTYTIYDQFYRVVLTDSICEFLKRFLKGGVFDSGGLYDWRDEVRANTK